MNITLCLTLAEVLLVGCDIGCLVARGKPCICKQHCQKLVGYRTYCETWRNTLNSRCCLFSLFFYTCSAKLMEATPRSGHGLAWRYEEVTSSFGIAWFLLFSWLGPKKARIVVGWRGWPICLRTEVREANDVWHAAKCLWPFKGKITVNGKKICTGKRKKKTGCPVVSYFPSLLYNCIYMSLTWRLGCFYNNDIYIRG